MKLLEILKENELDALAGSFLDSVGPTSGSEEQIREVQEALRRHGLMDASGRITPPPAYNGPIDGVWNDQLSAAVVAWHTSISMQRFNAPDRWNHNVAQIMPQDIEYLTNSAIKPDGMLEMARGETDPRATRSTNLSTSMDAQTYQRGPLQRSDPATIQTTRNFVDAIGFTGWIDIFTEILRVREGDDDRIDISPSQRTETITDNWQMIHRNAQGNIRGWLNTWRTSILRTTASASATLDDGTEMPFMPRDVDNPRAAYEYFFTLANGLHQKFARQARERGANREDVATNPDATTLSSTDINSKALALANAMDNDLWGLVTRGGTDEDSVLAIFRSLQTAQDYNNLSERFASNEGESLEERLVDELDDDEYNRIVRVNLARIRRINPRAMHLAIRFDPSEDRLAVELNGTTYRVDRDLVNNNPAVYQGNTQIRDAILEDAVLRQAVLQTEGTVPDLHSEISQETKEEVAAIFIATIQETYPEMVAFYTNQDPFSATGVDIGGMRLNGIMHEAGILLNSGAEDLEIMNWMKNEIESDHLWLVGDGTEANPGNANIYFDPRYQPEGLGRERNIPVGDIDSDVELTDDEERIVTMLQSNNDAQIREAIGLIAASPNPTSMWENIYAGYHTRGAGRWLDEDLADDNTIENLLNGQSDDSPLGRVVRELNVPLPNAAPYLVADALWDAIDGIDFFATNDELEQLVMSIQDRHQYDLVNHRYNEITRSEGGDDLIDDVGGEEFLGLVGGSLYNHLAGIIGEEELETARAGFTEEVRRSLRDFVENPNLETITELDQDLTVAVLEEMEWSSYRTLIAQLRRVSDAIEEGDVILDDEALSTFREMLDRLVANANDKYEESWSSWFNWRWFRSLSQQGDVPGWFNG